MFLLLFVDGIGLGGGGPANPFAEHGGPILRALAGLPPDLPSGALLTPVDAALGVPGLPQSATGQTALFTGLNAAADLGHHLFGFPNARLRALLAEHSFLKTARDSGRRVGFLNPFPPDFLRTRPRARVSSSTWAAVASGEPLRTPEDLLAGRAVSFDLTGEVLRAHGWPAPRRTPEDAGRTLVRAAREVDLALFETFLSDKAGHSRDMTWARYEVRRLRGMLDGVLSELRPGERVCLTSDHGNLEDMSTPSHTRNAVPAFFAGLDPLEPAAVMAARATKLTEIAPLALTALGIDPIRAPQRLRPRAASGPQA